MDYRYSAARSEMKEFVITDSIRELTQKVADLERGTLIGFDFLVSDKGLVPLEANPGPGWAWYHSHEVCKVSFIKEFLNFLKSFSSDSKTGSEIKYEY